MSESLATIIVPKSGMESGKGRNNIGDLLASAGYDVREKFGRNDQAQQGDLRFLAIKGADALAAQLERLNDKPYALLMGSDVLAEADLTARRRGVSSRIQRLLTIGAGPCTLRFLAPEENPVTSEADLEGRHIFSKYPAILSKALGAMDVRAKVRRTEGADTRVNEWRTDDTDIAALEIVGSGDTARANKLQIVDGQTIMYPEGRSMGLEYFDFNNIATDLFVSDARNLSLQSRGAIRDLGLALEAALTSHRYVAFKFNVPIDDVKNFRDLGMKGPTISPVLSRDGQEWRSMEVYVPEPEQNRMRSTLMDRGAKDLSSMVLHVEVDASTSEVLRGLPFFQKEAPSRIDARLEEQDDDENIAGWLASLSVMVDERAGDTEGKSGTGRALNMGAEFCAARYVGETIELSKAVRSGTRDDIVAEAGQCVYWFLVALKSGGVSFEDVVKRMAEFGVDVDSDIGSYIYGAIRKSRESLSDVYGIEDADSSVAYAEQSTEFSTALRKTKGEAAVAQAAKSFEMLLQLIEREVTLKEVMEKERGPKK